MFVALYITYLHEIEVRCLFSGSIDLNKTRADTTVDQSL